MHYCRPFLPVLALLLLIHPLLAGESALTTTYHPLDGLGSGKIIISPVTCHDWYTGGSSTTAIGLISARNVPPTNNPEEATEDLNLASVCNTRFSTSDLGDPQAPLQLTMDVTGFTIPRRYHHPREDIIRASLECLRRCLPEMLRNTPLNVVAAEKDQPWLAPIIKEFNEDRTRAFPPTEPISGQLATEQSEAADKFFRSYLADCPEGRVRCLWFLGNRPGVGMIMAFDFQDRTVFTERHVYNWARQAGRHRGLSEEEIIVARHLLSRLPKEDKAVPFNEGVHISFWHDGALRSVTYSRAAVPVMVGKLYDIGGVTGHFKTSHERALQNQPV